MNECMPKTGLDAIYEVAKSCLNKQITLDPNIPHELGCAEAVSYVLKKAGYDVPGSILTDLPDKGIPGTGTMYEWLKRNPLFKEIFLEGCGATPPVGSIIISPAGHSTKGYPHGHVGIVAKWGILSNDSNTGLFLEFYDLESWHKFFGVVRGLPTYFFVTV